MWCNKADSHGGARPKTQVEFKTNEFPSLPTTSFVSGKSERSTEPQKSKTCRERYTTESRSTQGGAFANLGQQIASQQLHPYQDNGVDEANTETEKGPTTYEPTDDWEPSESRTVRKSRDKHSEIEDEVMMNLLAAFSDSSNVFEYEDFPKISSVSNHDTGYTNAHRAQPGQPRHGKKVKWTPETSIQICYDQERTKKLEQEQEQLIRRDNWAPRRSTSHPKVGSHKNALPPEKKPTASVPNAKSGMKMAEPLRVVDDDRERKLEHSKTKPTGTRNVAVNRGKEKQIDVGSSSSESDDDIWNDAPRKTEKTKMNMAQLSRHATPHMEKENQTRTNVSSGVVKQKLTNRDIVNEPSTRPQQPRPKDSDNKEAFPSTDNASTQRRFQTEKKPAAGVSNAKSGTKMAEPLCVVNDDTERKLVLSKTKPGVMSASGPNAKSGMKRSLNGISWADSVQSTGADTPPTRTINITKTNQPTQATIQREQRQLRRDVETHTNTGEGNEDENLTDAKRNKIKSNELYDSMLEKNKQFFSRQYLYESKITLKDLEKLLTEVGAREKDNSELRHQFLLRLMRTKFAQMDGPVTGFLTELIRGNPSLEELNSMYQTIMISIIDFLDEILYRIPHCTSTYSSVTTIMSLLRKVANIDQSSVEDRLKDLEESLRDPTRLLNAVNDPTRNWSSDLEFIREPLIPELETLLNSSLPKKYKNLIDRSYGEAKKYIEIWFRLMREDFISPLKTAINDYKALKKNDREQCTRLKEGFFYKFRGFEKIESGLYELNFSEFKKNKLNHIDWALSSRLRGDSMIVLSQNHFKTSVYAFIQRPSQTGRGDRKKGRVLVKLSDSSELRFTSEFHGIEPKAFWEPYRCILERLRNQAAYIANGYELPMQKYLVELNKNVQYPCYLSEGTVLRTQTDDVAILGSSDALSKLPLDKSQQEALEMALSHELSVIQGPPGCGKSYVGALLVDLLIENKRLWQHHDTGCILLMAYTNHAIDQFVKECEDMGMDMKKTVRIGSRGNESMQPFLLKNRWSEIREMREYGDIYWEGSRTRKQLAEIDKTINDTEKTVASQWLDVEVRIYRLFMSDDHKHQFINRFFGDIEHEKIIEWMEGDTVNLTFVDITPMDHNEALHVKNVFALGTKKRRQLFAYWCTCAQGEAVRYLQTVFQWRERLQKKLDNIRRDEDNAVVRNANIIAMTTTGASKHSHFLDTVQPKIVVVEEAAEVLESHVVAPLTRGCKHLVLIGDHQQLRPTIAEYRLQQENRNLEVSLFERLIMNDMPNRRLEVQHRMHPEIADILVPHIYPSLIHHPTVELYPPVLGVTKRMTLIHHTNHEHRIGENSSYMNHHEAELIVALCRYLLQQGYRSHEITILSTYAGQARLIRSLIGHSYDVLKEEIDVDTGDDVEAPENTITSTTEQKKDQKNRDEDVNDRNQMPYDESSLGKVKVTTVDNFQGEENKIILLSFVRSNKEEQIGFLASSNRICVALSRAKHGFYAMGNFLMFARKSDIWQKLCRQLYTGDEPKLSPTLDIVCQRHQIVQEIIDADSFTLLAPEGGCHLPCDHRLDCGHACTRKCHPDDIDHTHFNCMKPCPGLMNCGHLCNRPCSVLGDDHGFSVMETFQGTLRYCEHCEKKCDCDVMVEHRPLCGHVGEVKCSQISVYKCQQMVLKTLPCGHDARAECSQDPSEVQCRNSDEHYDENCGHKLKRECYKRNWACTVMVPKIMPDCGHTIKVKCSELKRTHACDKEVEVTRKCGEHKVMVQCCDKNKAKLEPCKEIVTHYLDCNHYVRQPCHESIPPHCWVKVSEQRKCGHYVRDECENLAQTMAAPCSERVKRYRACGHYQSVPCEENDERPLKGRCQHNCSLSCSHGTRCRGHKCHQRCPPCQKQCDIHCMHTWCNRKCHQECDRRPCDKRCTKNLQCGHQCQGLCGEICPKYCNVCAKKGGYDSFRITMKPCYHDVELIEMDQHMGSEQNEHVQVIEPKYCPFRNCGALITYCPRYGNYIKRYLRLLKQRDYQKDSNGRWLFCKKCNKIYNSDPSKPLPDKHICRGSVKDVSDEEDEVIRVEETDEQNAEEAPEENEDWAVRPPDELRENVFFRKLSKKLFSQQAPRQRDRPRAPLRPNPRPRPNTTARGARNPRSQSSR